MTDLIISEFHNLVRLPSSQILPYCNFSRLQYSTKTPCLPLLWSFQLICSIFYIFLQPSFNLKVINVYFCRLSKLADEFRMVWKFVRRKKMCSESDWNDIKFACGNSKKKDLGLLKNQLNRFIIVQRLRKPINFSSKVKSI